ncbi:hypothetical protein [Candidatus Arthromitus sp. SFB-rat-Yit]|uniref:hypothetical protein n=1 Tax=Candidatus Arthromitus sp. SFB-rat-Yit TaxID=1041504 RepID=UPI000227A503|nr:hypothetical protein [Candidatus Arthromitus sp. SFB-rat-Yit]BAK81588.1 hypothetical protein RATSFB_1026 [Candidatus Arthromitus sp. SFB-rat-Yit]
MLHILNTLERDITKKFVDSMNFGMENITNEYFLKVLYINDEERVYNNKSKLDFVEHGLEYNLKFEDKIFRFFEDIFKLNHGTMYVGNFNIDKIDNMKILYMLRDLDYKDSIKLINILRSHVRDEDVYKINDFGVFKMFMSLCTREIHFTSFYFDKLDIMVFTHYDLSMLMFFKNENDINTYVQLAKINDLSLKDQELGFQNKPLIEVVNN